MPATARLTAPGRILPFPAPRPLRPLLPPFGTLNCRVEAETGTVWAFMSPKGRPSFTPDLVNDLQRLQARLRELGRSGLHAGAPLRHFVLGSNVPGSFNLGGDLTLFARCIRSGDRDALRSYGHACVRELHDNTSGYDCGAVSIALVQGEALGGGFECALAFDVIVAERRARFGFPEILFNLFPGMGAYSYLSRRIAPALAERMILSGRIHTAEELHAMGVVDILAEDGEGERAVSDYLSRQARRYNAQRAICQARRRVNPVPLQELLDVVDIWVEAALALEEADLRRMERLAAAQQRRHGAPACGAVAATARR